MSWTIVVYGPTNLFYCKIYTVYQTIVFLRSLAI